MRDRIRGGSHSSRRPVARCAQATNPGLWGETPLPPSCERRRETPIRSCSGWGLPCGCRCRNPGALLPHPFTLACDVRSRGDPSAVCSLWHFPSPPRPKTCSGRGSGRALPATLVTWSPDFPRSLRCCGSLAAARPPGRSYLARPWSRSKSSWNRIARICPSISPSIFSGRQRRWNASTALRLSLMS